ncbi:uncharacterized protein LOC118599606 isoform X1 [Oryzias melastigma]|uniref:uncharacterized protein LOC118599606 isoform X1 n=1 Tax=Oryzias melastigma TaxID=30732 RepID=UPI00168D29B2|nr:uncharacterized protein LOC118599606 isoform X1 [Oryzias melastigma]
MALQMKATMTPITILSVQYPQWVNEIPKISNKWHKRTQKLDSPWPQDGTFDVDVCTVMETRIKDYKPKVHSKKRNQKRQTELQILDLFKTEGQNYRDKIRGKLAELKNLKIKSNNEKDQDFNTSAGIYPSLAGTLSINGNFEYDKANAQKGTSFNLNVEASPQKAVGGSVDARSPGTRAENAHSLPVERGPCDSVEEINREQLQPQHCSTGRKAKKPRQSQILDCYAERTAQREGAQSESYWIDMADQSRLNQPRIKEKTIIEEYEEQIDKIYNTCKELQNLSANAEAHCNAERKQKKGREEPYDLRYRPNIHPPDRYTDPGQFPILIKGTQAHYIPWQSVDLTGLVARLPDLHDGAAKWIRVFEEETVGKMLAIGDIKAVLAQILGVPTMENIIHKTGYVWMKSHMADGTVFNAYRATMWQALREEFPNKIDRKARKGEPLMDNVNPIAYINKQMKRWKQETEEEPERSPLLMTLFRESIIEALPAPAQAKLEDVVGLSTMPHRQFRDHVVHVVEKYRKEQEQQREQDTRTQRKVTQLQLNELQNKGKAKTQAPVLSAEPRDIAGWVPVQQSGAAPPVGPPASAPQVQQPPVVNVYSQQAPGPRNGRFAGGPRSQRGSPMGYPRAPQTPGLCWGCQSPSHLWSQCPNNIGKGLAYGKWSRQPRPRQNLAAPRTPGPANYWAGQKYGY